MWARILAAEASRLNIAGSFHVHVEMRVFAYLSLPVIYELG
jgi:hypothetical protein